MKVNKVLTDKIITMAEEIGQSVLDGLDRNYYERDIVDRVQAGEEISITEAVEAITWLREEINDRQEANCG
jgi:hypothetical protein